MKREEILKRVIDIVNSKIEGMQVDICEATNFRSDLALDSIKLVDSIVDIEETFEVEIPDVRLFKINTVGDLVDFIEEEA